MAIPKLRKIDTNKPKKKKILLLSDDMRMHSGIGTMSREFVLGTCGTYDWIQVGGAIKHPDAGKIIDISLDAQKETGISDASVKIYPVSGYGDQSIIRHLMQQEKPDAIIHFTDPRLCIILSGMIYLIHIGIQLFTNHVTGWLVYQNRPME